MVEGSFRADSDQFIQQAVVVFMAATSCKPMFVNVIDRQTNSKENDK